MTDISDLRKREIVDEFRRIMLEKDATIFEAADAVAQRYGMSRREVLDLVKEIGGQLPGNS